MSADSADRNPVLNLHPIEDDALDHIVRAAGIGLPPGFDRESVGLGSPIDCTMADLDRSSKIRPSDYALSMAPFVFRPRGKERLSVSILLLAFSAAPNGVRPEG
jgi:hypothetical protein